MHARITMVLFGGLLALLGARNASADDPTLQTVDAGRFGIRLRVPVDWKVVRKEHNDQAVVLELPPSDGQRTGFAACELGVAPESLEEYRRRIQATDEREQQEENPRRKLTENRIEKLGSDEDADEDNEQENGKKEAEPSERLVSVWKYQPQAGQPEWHELRTRIIRHDTMYTFVLSAPAEHFEGHRERFEDVMRAAAYSEPETGVRRMPGGYWMQREYRFALKLPEGWKPSFGPHDKVLFFASGDKHEVFTDNLIVLASPKRDLDLVKLQETLPGEIAQADPKAEIEQCKVVLQGDEEALESVIHIQRGPFKITIFERRFSGKECNYEVRYTLERSAFEKTEKALRKSLESFKEIEGQIPQRGKS